MLLLLWWVLWLLWVLLLLWWVLWWMWAVLLLWWVPAQRQG